MALKIAEDLFRCPRCEDYKHREDFGKHSCKKHGINAYCRPCAKAANAENRAAACEPKVKSVPLRRHPGSSTKNLEKFYSRFN